MSQLDMFGDELGAGRRQKSPAKIHPVAVAGARAVIVERRSGARTASGGRWYVVIVATGETTGPHDETTAALLLDAENKRIPSK